MKVVKMIVADKSNPKKFIVVSAPSPGHYNYIIPAFRAAFPKYQNKRFSVSVQECRGVVVEDGMAYIPEGGIDYIHECGELSEKEFVNLAAGIKAPNMRKKIK